MFAANKQKIRILIGDSYNIRLLSQLKCFWTWPFSHIWFVHGCCDYDRRCENCHLVNTRGGWDGGGYWMYDISRRYYPIKRIVKHYIISIISIIIFLGVVFVNFDLRSPHLSIPVDKRISNGESCVSST